MASSRASGALIAALLLALSPAPAAGASCGISSAGTNFGTIDPLAGAPRDGVGSIRVSCDGEASYTLQLSPGSGSYSQRRMTGASGQLAYNLYTDSARAIVWGDGSGGTGLVSRSGNADVPVYGRVPSKQDPHPGSYSDTVIVTITY